MVIVFAVNTFKTATTLMTPMATPAHVITAKLWMVMLVIVLTCNLLLENVLEPRVMSSRLSIHPLVVLLATTAGGIIGGMVGLILAVPVAVLVIDLVRRLRASGLADHIQLKVPALPHVDR